jgi:hypothetical protein
MEMQTNELEMDEGVGVGGGGGRKEGSGESGERVRDLWECGSVGG